MFSPLRLLEPFLEPFFAFLELFLEPFTHWLSRSLWQLCGLSVVSLWNFCALWGSSFGALSSLEGARFIGAVWYPGYALCVKLLSSELFGAFLWWCRRFDSCHSFDEQVSTLFHGVDRHATRSDMRRRIGLL